MSLVYKIL